MMELSDLSNLTILPGTAGAYCDPVTGECYPPESAESGTLARSLAHLGRQVAGRLDAALAAEGLSIAKLGVLRALVQAGEPLPLSQIAGELACVKSNITQLIDRLEADGLVTRIADLEDRRSTLAGLTPAGRRVYTAGAKIEAQVEGDLFQRLNGAEQDQLKTILDRLTESLHDISLAEAE